MKGLIMGMIVILVLEITGYGQNCVNCNNAMNTGQGSSAIGYNAQSTGDYSIALGFNSLAGGLRAISIGNQAITNNASAMAFGNFVTAGGLNAFTIGTGYSGNFPLINNIQNSLMIGFNSDVPTLFISPALGQGYIGKVGIGTTNPTEPLSVKGIIESKLGGFKYPDGTVQTTKALDPWQMASNNKISYMNGDVGIGTNNPVARLDVFGDIVLGKPGENFIIHSRAWVGDALVIAPQNNNGGWDWSKSISLKDNGQFFIGGDLDISSPHTGYKLAVNGKTICKEVIVTIQHWADDVFAEGYSLTELSDIQKYIEKNHHLPGVPTQQDVLDNGVYLGEMNKILLTKVEELTLHAINMQQQIDELIVLMNQK